MRSDAALPDIIAAPALLRELRELGYSGQLRSLQAFMRAHQPLPKDDPVVRFETPPGQQMQCDFVVFRRGADPLYAFTATLGYSRWRWARYASNERSETLVTCHHALFETLGGVPKEIVGRKVIMSHFAQSNSEPLISTVMPFCAKADNASEGSMDVHPCTHRPGSVTARSGASSGYLTQYGGALRRQ